MTTMPRGRFVCLEGIDGAGKTTAVAALGEALRRRGVAATVFGKHDCPCASAYVEAHLSRLHGLIWGHPGDDPYLELGDWHWIHLQAAWYEAVSRCVVTPLLEAGTLVVTDTWTYKFLAKLSMRPLDFERARSLFDGVVTPDLVICLDVDPRIAAARKQAFGISESGNHKGAVDLTGRGFIDYQQRVAGVLTQFAQADTWTSLDVNALTVTETAIALTEIITSRYSDVPGHM